ncbi:MAG: DUF72 domain-containing protein [Candidatus Dormibacteraeota bacterium]|nr:DUF72 domain-containing protein [Candidatus Dormibacteraeota bacterium]
MARVGTSGWQYDHWRGTFYAEDAPASGWLATYADRFDTVEINSTFYRLPAASAVDRWREGTPGGFLFAVKMSRYFTHVRRLRDAAEPVAHFLERVQHLRTQLGPVLVQLPPTMPIDLDRLVAALRCFPGSQRVAVEFRHESWFEASVRDALAELGAAFVLSDRDGTPHGPLWRTASWTYLRMHGGAADGGNYTDADLREWTQRLRELGAGEAYVYFNNDAHGHAPRNAGSMRRLLTSLEPAHS